MKKVVNYFHITLGITLITIDELITFAFGIKTTGDPDILHPSYTDLQIQALATAVQTDLGTRATEPNPTLTRQEQLDVDALSRAIISVKSDVEVGANKKAQGNKVIFDLIVTRTGFGPRADYHRRARLFEFVPSEPNSFHIHVPGEEDGPHTYYYKYGITTAFYIQPKLWEPRIAYPVTDFIVNGIPAGTIIAVQYAVLARPKHNKRSKKLSAPPDVDNGLTKMLTIPTVNDKGKIVITHRVEFLNWSDVIYYMIPGAVGAPEE